MGAREPYPAYSRTMFEQRLAGVEPPLPVDVDELERAAAEALSPDASAHLFGGAGTADTIRANRDAFQRHRIVPRVMQDVTTRDLSCTLLGTALPAPVLLAPIGVQTVIHPEGELASARAAATLGLPFVASTMGTKTLEEIAEASGPDSPRWFQLYWPTDPELLASFVGRAEAAGYSAIVLTVDCFVQGWKPADLDAQGPPGLRGIGNVNFLSDPVFCAALARTPADDPRAANDHYLRVCANPSLTWAHLETLRELTRLPIVIKGIQHPDDARAAIAHGADAVVCSNHGGRQVDGAIASLDALPGIAAAVAGGVPVLFDSGIRTGADIIKALALGADAVMVGRPWLFGLALAGERGVEHVLRCLLAELELTLALTGNVDARALSTVLA